MSNIETFDFNGDEVRITIKENQPWFIGKDLLFILEKTSVDGHSISKLDTDDKDFIVLDDTITKIVSEYGVYSLFTQSDNPKLNEFKRWIKTKVLPSVREKIQSSVGEGFTEKEETLILKCRELNLKQAALETTRQTMLKLQIEIEVAKNEIKDIICTDKTHSNSDDDFKQFLHSTGITYGKGYVTTQGLMLELKNWYVDNNILEILQDGSEAWIHSPYFKPVRTVEELIDKVIKIFPNVRLERIKLSDGICTHIVGLVRNY